MFRELQPCALCQVEIYITSQVNCSGYEYTRRHDDAAATRRVTGFDATTYRRSALAGHVCYAPVVGDLKVTPRKSRCFDTRQDLWHFGPRVVNWLRVPKR